MIIRLALPITELLVVIAFIGLVAICAMAMQLTGPGDGPPEFGDKSMHVIGNKLYTEDGRYRADWIPPKNGESGYWKSTSLEMQQLPGLNEATN